MTTTTLSHVQERSSQTSYLRALFGWESVLFAVICLADLGTTLLWVHQGIAREANPVLAPWLRQGDIQFCLAKLVSFVPMLLVAAWYRMQNPNFIAVALRLAIVAYLVIYTIGVGGQFLS